MSIDFSPLAGFGRIEFYFLRHGKSEGNHKDIVQGLLDYPLSESGREQARFTGEWLRGKGVDFVVCTPLARGKETAGIIAETAGFPKPEELAELRELDTGVFTGLTLDEARGKHPAVWDRFMEKSWEGVDGAERIDALLGRAEEAWKKMIERMRRSLDARTVPVRPGEGNATGTEAAVRPGIHPACLAVAHAGILQWLLKATLDGKSWFPLLPMGNCGIYLFTIEGRVTRWEKINFQAPGVTGSR